MASEHRLRPSNVPESSRIGCCPYISKYCSEQKGAIPQNDSQQTTFGSPPKYRFSIAVLGGFLGSVLLYSINFGLSAGEAVVATIGRVLLVPPNTEAFWFLVYPKQIAFLGPAYTWNTNIDIIRQTALAATGDVFSANASFIAVGWSGLGFLGVLLNGVALLFYVHLIEVAFSQNITPYLRNLILALFAVPLFFLLSGTVGDFLFKGGLTPLLIAWNLPLSSRKGGYLAHSLLNSLQLKS